MNKVDHRLSTALACLVCLCVTGCTASATASPPAEATAVPSQTTAATSTPPKTATRTPWPTEIPYISRTLAPALTLSPNGPWLLFLAASDHDQNARNLWATNANGSNMNKLVDENVVTFAIQPGHSLNDEVLVAYVTRTNYDSRDLTLKLLHLPGGQAETISPLLTDKEGQPPVDATNAWIAISDGGLAWSADGRELAFVGQIDGLSMDVYRYEVATRSIHWLSSGEDQACRLEWSSDQRWIIHQGFKLVGMGGPEIDGVWSARVDGAGTVTLAESGASAGFKGQIEVLGWLDAGHLMIADRDYETGNTIKSVDIATGAASDILTAKYSYAAYSHADDIWLLVDNAEHRVGLFHNGKMTDIPGYDLSDVWWSDPYGVFMGSSPDHELYTISSSGLVTRLSISGGWLEWNPPIIISAPDKSFWAWHDFDNYSELSELWIGRPMAQPALIAARNPDLIIQEIIWLPDSKRLFLFTDHGLWAAKRPDFKLVQVVDGSYTSYWYGSDPQWVN